MAPPQDPRADTKALMARALVELREARERVGRLEDAARAPVAVVGMGCRFPGAASAAAFERLLWNGDEAISRVPRERWDSAAYPDASAFGGFLDDVARFDAGFFGLSPREAESMDPQHRVLLETAWHALEHANIPPASLRGTDTGVFAGICTYDYAIRHLAAGGADVTAHFGTGNALSAAAGRLSYLLGFNGPSMAIDTACSSSLVAVHLAIQSLRQGECAVALAGGVNLMLAPQTTLGFSRANMLAADGRCKPFAASANGYVRGEGCGIVVLKRLADAERDGDPILAILRGSAVNQDGASSGLTVPNGPAQQQVIRRALENAGIDPGEVGYVEAHGTGTPLGDPIEARSLGEVYGRSRTRAPLVIGSVKSNIGHLEGAAGVASLMKAVLALRRASIPPTLHVSQPSGAIDWTSTRLEVATRVRDWPDAPRRIAGVSSFGFTGTNAHVIVEAVPPAAPQGAASGPVVIPVSAPDPATLDGLVQQFGALVAERPDAASDVAAVAALGRQHFRHRRAIALTPGPEAAALAARYVAGEDIDWAGLCDASARRRLHVPEYPFAGGRHWLAEGVQLETAWEPRGADGFGDHRVFGRVVVPAAAYIDLLARAGRQAVGADAVEIAGLSIRTPLTLADAESTLVRTVVEPAGDGMWRARVETSSGTIATAEIRTAEAAPLAALPEAAGDPYPVELIYRECAARGLEYGPAFQTLRDVRREGDVVRATVAMRDVVSPGAVLPPALLDGCLQASAVMYPALAEGQLLLPVSVRRVVVHRAAGAEVECRAVLIHRAPGRVEVSVELFTPSGDAVAAVEGIVLVTADRDALAGARGKGPVQRLVPAWRKAAAPPAIRPSERVAVVHAGESLPATAGPVECLVVLGPPDVTPEGVPGVLARLRDTLVAAANRTPRPARVVVATAGAADVDGATPSPEQAALAAMVRTARAELPGLSIACVDVADGAWASAAPADSLFDAGMGETAFRGGVRYVRELVAAPAASAQPVVLRADRTYVISGGLGDVGLHIARWMVERGARTLVLFGRTAAETRQQQAIDALRRDARVDVEALDVADGPAVDCLFARLAAQLPPVAGIVHAAAVTRDALLPNLTRDDFAQVWAPKVDGARHLIRHARALAVDRLMFAGSMAGTFGAPGQANYAAANAWLEAAATAARREGVPATCVSFGPWEATGLAGRLEASARRAIEARGVRFLAAADALEEFGLAWASGDAHRVVYAGASPDARPLAPSPRPVRAEDVAGQVAELVASVLRSTADRVDPAMPLVSMGLDSLMALELRSHCRERFAVDVAAADFVGDATVASIAARIERASSAIAAAAPAAADEPAELPLSHGQLALWYLHELQPESPAYNIAFAARVRSRVDVASLRQRVQAVVERHGQLRRVYRQSEAGVRQHFLDRVPEAFRQHDAAGLSDAALFDAVRAAYREPFDLERGPVFRAALFTRAEEDHVLLLAMHHVAGDAWSLWQILEELRGESGIAPAFTYADHVAEEAAFLASPEAEASWHYWRRELDGELPVLALPTDRPRPAVQTLTGASVPFSLAADDSRALQALARREGVTLYALLLAAFQVLLHRWSGQSDIIVGCPTAGRDRTAARRTVGYFVNPIALRARMAEGETFRDRLRDAGAKLVEGMAHQRLPFPIVADRVAAAGHADRSPVFQAAFVMQQLQEGSALGTLLAPASPPVRVGWGDLTLEHYFLPQQEGQFDLTLEVVQAHGACHGLFKYNSDLWDAATIDRMSRHFTTLLRSIVADPSAALAALDLLPSDERAALQDAAAGPVRDYALDVPLHRWIEQQVQRTPEAVAVVSDSGALTYAELNVCANRLARELQARGVGAGVLVPICADRGHGLIVALLATLKAGGAYVPLDPAYPADRLRLMVTDTAAPVVLAESRTQHVVSTAAGDLPLLLLDDVRETWRHHASDDLPFATDTNAPAYAIFTSGSTGQPKGALNSHRAIVNRLCWMQEAFGLTAGDRVLQKTPCSFDVSVWEFFWPLMTGARLVFAKPNGHRDNAYLAGLIREAGITTLHFVPPMLQAFLDEPAAASCSSIRRVICSGQELPATLQRRVFEVLPGAELHNLYGPTEAAVDVTWHRCAPGDTRAFVPIGRPIANTSIYILGPARQPVPFGVAGELYIGGVQVGLGYLNRPELTADRFVADPFGPPGARLYRTGDVARVHAGGDIEFLGRTDFQVKIRGLRVELGEIEHVLASHPSVREALVLLRDDRPGGARLVAYVVAAAGHDRSAEREVREAIATALPAYMVPDAFVWLDAMPLTANGKVDRRALPAPALARAASRPPQSTAEQALAGIWRRILDIDEVGADDNFFSLGGDSISSTRMVAAARGAGLELTVRDVLAQPTLAALAARARHDLPVAAAVPPGSAGDVPLLPMQRRFFAADAPRFEQAIVLHADDPLDEAALRSALDDLVHRHDALRLRFSTGTHGVPVQAVVEPEASPVAWGPAMLDIERGPIAAARLDDDRRSLRLTVHHLAVDGASWRTLARDLETAYRARLGGAAPVFLDPAPSFRAWAEAAVAFAASESAASEAVYWLTERWEDGVELRLPPAEPGGQVGAGHASFAVSFDAASGEAAQARLLAALGTAWANGDEPATLRIDLEGHGREPLLGVDGSSVVGWCTALFPVRLSLGSDTLDARAAAIAGALAEVPSGGRGFGLCRDLSPNPKLRRALNAVPPAAAVFNYLGRVDAVTGSSAGRLFSRVSLPAAAELRGEHDRPAYPLEINAYQQGGELHVELRYDRTRIDAAWVEQMALRCRALLSNMDSEPYPLTPMQEGILFHALLHPGAGSYVQQVVARFDGAPDVEGLRHAWDAVLERHAALRNVFRWTGLDRPRQQPLAPVRMPWQVEDWRGKDTAAFERDLERWLIDDRARGFDLAAGPLHRVHLLLADGGCTLVWTHHHILLDGRGMFLVLHDVLEHVRAAAAGRTPALPPAVPFRTFAATVGQPTSAAALEFWTRELSPFTARTEIPFLARAAEGTAYDAREEVRMLAAEDAEALRARARAGGVSLHLLVQAALALHLRRLSGSDAVLFGTTVSAPLADEAAVGLYINTIPAPFAVPTDVPFAEWLAAERTRHAARSPFEFTGLADVQRCAPIPAGEPLFDLLFVFDNYPLGAGLVQPAGGLTPRAARVVEQTTFPLVLSILPGDAIEVRLQHDASRYSPAAASSFLDGFASLLRSVARAPIDTLVAQLGRLEGKAREQILEVWNRTAVEVPADRCVHDIIQAQAAAHPDRIAIRAGGRSITYGELDARARRIAWALGDHSVGRGAVVGLCAGRSADTVAAMLGILYAGAAYLPLDPAFPEDRLGFMLEDAGAALTLCDPTAGAPLRARLAAAAPVLDLSSIDDHVSPGSTGAPARTSDLMYVLYTSGSTGRPKGVQIPHRAVVNLLSTMKDEPGLGPEDVVLALTTFSFDIAVVEIFLTLSVGATMVMADHAADPRHVLRLVADEQVTLIQATPASYRLLLEAGWPRRPGLRAFCGGEALSRDLSRAILQRCDRLWNLYGPTETTVYSIGCEVQRMEDEVAGAEPIGRPLANTLAYVLDERLQPVPVGASGELFIAGAGVGDGYRGNAALTAERFLPNPFDAARGPVMYRTGDRARWRPDGTLDYLGRLDHQVKLRGYRIELEEIESVLGSHPSVAHAVVTSRQDRPGDISLVAYVTVRGDRLDDKSLREHLRSRVPDYMVPARFVRLDRMPRTPSGKIDRRALPAPEVEPRREGRAAGTPMEEEIAAIIGGVLDQDAIPVNESFFDLGGHSLHLLQVQTRMAERFGVSVDIVEFFRHPTVQALAALVERLRQGGTVEAGAMRERSDARLTQQETRRQQLDARRGARAGRPRA